MERIFSSSEMDKQRRDWHHALVRVEKGDKPYLSADDHAYRTMKPGSYLVEMQRNRNNAPITYTWISDVEALELIDIHNTEPEKAIELMAKLVA
jgi:hypothetical protein